MKQASMEVHETLKEGINAQLRAMSKCLYVVEGYNRKSLKNLNTTEISISNLLKATIGHFLGYAL